MTPNCSKVLDLVCAKTDCTQSEVVDKAITLYAFAVLGVEEGKFVGLADDPRKLERAFTGFFKELDDDEPEPSDVRSSFFRWLKGVFAR